MAEPLRNEGHTPLDDQGRIRKARAASAQQKTRFERKSEQWGDLAELVNVPDPSSSPEETVLDQERLAEQRELLERYLLKRSPGQRDIIERYLNGQLSHEIARDLHMQARGVEREIDDFTRVARSWFAYDKIKSEDVL